ncbi:hypothetical protein RHSIM_Rhsim11G0022800 [Rhododendron simsii]|uniref:non-specific serine/threonine protein kinase n=1 Tax=Rhododendron simsii TaxID=118357 RepID=A0A834G6Q6_RHOSS|nr:hypothetical protein RHSIM_Rhsim11G0022800 [Rhododendron simsii]
MPSWLAPKNWVFNGTYFNNRDEVSMFYTLIKASKVSTLFVDDLGSLKMVTWVDRWVDCYSCPQDNCDYYGRCGVYGYCDSNNGGEFECMCLPGYEPKSTKEWYLRDASGGCIKKCDALSMCGNGEGFVKVANAKIPDTSKAHVWMSLSVHECQDECLRNCTCLAYTSEAEGGRRAICITWYENLMDVRRIPNGGIDFYVRVDAVELGLSKTKRKMVAIVVTSVVLTSILIITVVYWLVMKKRRRRIDIQESDEENVELPIFDMVIIAGATNNFSDTNKIGEGVSALFTRLVSYACRNALKTDRKGIQESDDENVELPIFDMVIVARATNNFSETNKIGEGGFGIVYKFGSAMLSFSLKLKRLKPVLKNLNSQCFSNISGRVMEARSNMELLQAQCLLNLGDDSIQDLEKDAIRTYMELSAAEESFIKQKSIARVNWLALGDNNTKFFHH